ncbi:MAG: hypothetical protein JL50_11080 [Peptococcaceae bacterium BICA1-7]|nr:MAG: hypothetical protein JL50_11080 [Peptococcaceae bacterium BICA1-7]HBV95829.1 XRE family transcriptional regulator [Desulfotomaculum sp.]
MSLGERLKQAREEKGFTQIFAAKKLGVANTTLSGYENNDRRPDPNMLKKLAELYSVSPNWLLGIDHFNRKELKKHGPVGIDLYEEAEKNGLTDEEAAEILKAFGPLFKKHQSKFVEND